MHMKMRMQGNRGFYTSSADLRKKLGRSISLVASLFLAVMLTVGADSLQAQDSTAKNEDAAAQEQTEPTKTETEATEEKTAEDSTKAEAPSSEVDPESIPWIYRPYQVKVWLLVDDSARWTPGVLESVRADLKHQLEMIEPSAWRITVEVQRNPAFPNLRAEDLKREQLGEELYNSQAGIDKLFLVRLKDHYSHLQLSSNEVDVTGWSLGPRYQQEVHDSAKLVPALASLVAGSFRPVARIENTLSEDIMMLIRAYGLMDRVVENDGEYSIVQDKDSPCWIERDEIFEPVIRKANRQKKFELDKIEQPMFTLLLQNEPTTSSMITCRVVSAKRAEVALGRRTGKRTQRFGIVVRTPPGTTTIHLVTKRGPTLRDLTEFPLNGYEIYSRSIYGSEDSVEYLGKTNWTGKIDIPPGSDKEPVRLLFVKSGERLLARLPIMPGYKPLIKETLPDDDTRINAEGVVSGLRSQVLDLVARREVLLERMTQGLLAGESELQMTLQYFDMYDELMTLADWTELLATTQRRLVSNDSRQQKKIDAMFEELQTFADDQIRPIDDSEINTVVLAAKQSDWERVRQLIRDRQQRRADEKAAEAAAAAAEGG